MFDLVVIGSITNDKIRILGKGSEEWRVPGGSGYYSAFPPARMGLKVAVITKLAKRDSSLLEEFKEEGIKVFPCWSQKTTRIENTYPDAKNPDKRIGRYIVLPTPFELQEIPADIEAKIFYITSLVRGEIPLEIVKEVSRKGMVALDVQGFMRSFQQEDKEMRLDDWPEKDEILPLVDVLKVDKVEARILTGQKDPEKAARVLAFSGPKEIILTQDKGVLVYTQGESYFEPFTKEIRIEGRTGRGDTTAGAYLGWRILGKSPRVACRLAAAVCSLKMKSKGPFKGNLKDYIRKYHSK